MSKATVQTIYFTLPTTIPTTNFRESGRWYSHEFSGLNWIDKYLFCLLVIVFFFHSAFLFIYLLSLDGYRDELKCKQPFFISFRYFLMDFIFYCWPFSFNIYLYLRRLLSYLSIVSIYKVWFRLVLLTLLAFKYLELVLHATESPVADHYCVVNSLVTSTLVWSTMANQIYRSIKELNATSRPSSVEE